MNMEFTMRLLICLATLCIVRGGGSDETKDTREGENIILECRFSPQSARENVTYYWAKSTKQTHDNVAIGNVPLESNYKLNYHPEEGIYDLEIWNASYDRDNGKFECKVKAGGSGANLHVQRYTLTVLTLPQEPAIAPSSHVTVTEGKRQELTCSSVGGSPDPQVKWYKQGSSYPLDAALKNGGSRDQPTTATLSIIPSREDDESVFRCEVWNRALLENKKLIATVTLSVNYFPRVEVGPENPLRVEKDSPATLECTVDAKPKVSSVRWTRNGRFISNNPKHLIHKVSIQDAGKYTCSADNGLVSSSGSAGGIGRGVSEKEINLDVLYTPIVQLEAKTKEAEEGESVYIKCNVSSNPSPITIEWVKDGKPDFRQSGDTLRFSHVTAENSGTYLCRAINVIRGNERIGNGSIALLIRHKPGRARIMPDAPVATEGSAVTLTCTATPAGWPAPQYRWFRIGSDNQNTILATGTKYTLPAANLATEGVYNCQASNELGPGEMASVNLEVHQPPTFKYKLKPLETKRVGDPNFSIACSAKGKPKPVVKWLKDKEELTADTNLYQVKNEYSESSNNGAVTIQTVLRFNGKARPNGNELLPSDRGVYTCSFENQVKRSESSMHLKIEHEPIILHQYNKVAYDIMETAEVVCKVQAYPKPEFKWFYSTNLSPLQSSSEGGHYTIQTGAVEDDTFTSILRISNIKKQDYGEYNCQIVNNLGKIDTKIRLQPKGAPEKPTKLVALHIGHNSVSLGWEPGFNGGISNTKYFVSYKKAPTTPINDDDQMQIEGCGGSNSNSGISSKSMDWSEVDCLQSIPCNVTHLEQHTNYVFKVKALNTKGTSENSADIRVRTRVDRIPLPQRVTYQTNSSGGSRQLSITVPATCLPLIALIESMVPNQSWQLIETLPLHVSGLRPTYVQANLDQTGSNRGGIHSSSVLDQPIGVNEDDDEFDDGNYSPRIRVKFCLTTSGSGSGHQHCGDYVEAVLGSAYIREASALATPTMIAIVVSCIVFVLFVGLLLIFCRCKRNHESKKSQSKVDYEMDSVVRPTMIPSHQQEQNHHQPPPPYYPGSGVGGMENKALDLAALAITALDDDDHHQNKNNLVYATQNGYGYHHVVLPPPPPLPANDMQTNWGYLENNSYSNNSNNGGSLNSQDSLWQMKMAAANSNSHHQQQQQLHQQQQHQQLGYDPITHGGYGALDDYAPYPHQTEDGYLIRSSNNPSRQEYCTNTNPNNLINNSNPNNANNTPGSNDPYAAVHKPKKRIDSPYHDVTGLPDPYLEQMEGMDEKPPPQHMSLSYEESLESGYSTPNSRTRRVIREIIV